MAGTPRLTIHATSLEAAKNDMELALGKHIELLLGERAAGDRGQVA